MKRIATIGAIITAFAVAPSVAAAGNATAQAQPQISAQVVTVQVAKVQRAQAAISVQRHLVQVAQAKRFSLMLRAHVR
jgi:ABC-type arginine transport system ATPase subunit